MTFGVPTLNSGPGRRFGLLACAALLVQAAAFAQPRAGLRKSPGVTVAESGAVTVELIRPGDFLQQPYEYCWIEGDLPPLFSRRFRVTEAALHNAQAEIFFAATRGGVRVQFAPEGITLRHFESDGQGYPMAGRVKTNERSFGLIPTPRMPFEFGLAVTHDHQLLFTLDGRPALKTPTFLDFFGCAAFVKPVGAAAGARARFGFAPLAEGEGTAAVSLKPQEKHQTMLGWGGVTSIPAYWDLTPAQRAAYLELLVTNNLLIQRESPASDYLNTDADNWDSPAAARVHYDDAELQGEVSDFDFNRKLKERGGLVIAEFWRNPAQHYLRDAGGRVINQPDIRAMARSLVAYARAARARTGFAPDIIGVQNEPDMPNWVAPGFLPPERANELTKELRRQLDAAGFTEVRLHSANCARLYNAWPYVEALNADGGARRATAYFATNVYDFDAFAPDQFDAPLRRLKGSLGGLPFLAVEIGNNHADKQAHSYRLALGYAQLMHKLLTVGDAVGVAYIWTLLKSTHANFDWTRTLLWVDRANANRVEPSFYWRVFTAYSRHVKRGMRRVGANSDHPDLLVSAFADERGGLTVVAVNRASRDLRVSFDGAGAGELHKEVVSQTQPNAEAGRVRAGGARFTDVIRGGEIVTYSNVPLNK
jgi:O-glycosyl hydrolase